MKKVEDLIKTYDDFPKKGIAFKDVLGIIQDSEVFKELILKMSANQLLKNCDAIISIEARGFIFGSAISLQASKPMLVARKPGKLPGELISKDYQLEYGNNGLSLQREALKGFSKFSIVDDLLATGGTVNCVSQILIEQQKKNIRLICGC